MTTGSPQSIPIRHFTIRRRLDLECVQEISEALRQDGVDAVHSHEFAMAIHGTPVAHRLGCPHVINMHGNQTILDRMRWAGWSAGAVPAADWWLLIAGEGSYRPEVEAAIPREGLEDRVRLLGYRLDISNLQAAADIFAMPSLREGLPLALLEGPRPCNGGSTSVRGQSEAHRRP